MRRLTLPLVTAALIAPVAYAHAEPVAQARLAQTEFVLTKPDSTSQKVRLTVTNAARPRLTLQIADCDATGCTGFDYYETRLDPGAVAIDGTTAAGELMTALRGTHLGITWAPDDRLVLQGGAEGSSGDGGEAASVYRVEPAVAEIRFGDEVCTATAAVGDEVRTELPEGSTGAARPLDSFAPGTQLACAGP